MCVALTGCSTETGILVAVAGDTVDTLEFQLGVVEDGELILDRSVSGLREDVRGRNLRSDPFELMLKEDAQASASLQVQVLVLGIHEGEVGYLGLMDSPQGFVADEVVRRNVVLQRIRNNTRLTTRGESCFRAQLGEDSWQWRHRDDQDCDGYLAQGAPADCVDQDATVNPGADEICDGQDNTCDGQFAPDTEPCYGRDETTQICRQGVRDCLEAEGGGLGESCLVQENDPRRAEAFCEAYQQCDGAAVLRCANAAVDRHAATCTVGVEEETLCPEATLYLEPRSESSRCRWAVVSMPDGLAAGFGSNSEETKAAVEQCEVQLWLGGTLGTAGELVLEFFDLEAETSVVVELSLSPQDSGDEECPEEPVSCE